MKTIRHRAVWSIMFSAMALAGCAELPLLGGKTKGGSHPLAREVGQKREQPAARQQEQPSQAERERAALREGIRRYNDGDFNGAIKQLSSSDIAKGSLRTRVTALKYTAFSYCVTSRPAPCRQSFEKALRLDPAFELTPGERGHPLWGPVFVEAKSD